MPIIALADLKTFLGITGTSEDTSLTTILNAVLDFVPQYLNRTIDETTYTAELYDGPGQATLCLRNYPVISVTEVLVEGEEIEEREDTTDTDGYFLEANAGILVYDGLWNRGRGIIEITYKAGYSDTTSTAEDPHIPYPQDLRYAHYSLCSYYRNMKGKTGIISENLGSYSYRLANSISDMGGELTIPDIIIKNILDRYKSSIALEICY